MAYLLFPTYQYVIVKALPQEGSTQLWTCLDPSWTLAMNFANHANLEWGTDVIFTFGPLASLGTRIPWGESKWMFVLFDCFMFTNYLGLFYFSIVKSQQKIVSGLIIIVAVILIPANLGTSIVLVLMAFLIFWTRLSLDEPRKLYYIFQIILVLLMLFIKFNTGLVALPIFLIGLIYNGYRKQLPIKSIVMLVAVTAISVIFLSIIFHVNLPQYVSTGFEMVRGYNEIMYQSPEVQNSVRYMMITCGLLAIVLVANVLSASEKDYFKALIILAFAGISIFILYKQAFVRAGTGHIMSFFYFIPILILCNLDFYIKFRGLIPKALFIIALFTPAYFLMYELKLGLDIGEKLNKSQYISEFNNYTDRNILESGEVVKFPASILERIGNNTVDIFPWNIQSLFENRLNYSPRPICQSYAAYTPMLEQINFDHYNSSRAPEFVIFDLLSLENRYPFFEEARTNIVLQKNYREVGRFTFFGREHLLLQKIKAPKKVSFQKRNEYALKLGTVLIAKQDIYYEIEVSNTILGKFASIIDHAPEVNLEVKLKNGNQIYHRTSQGLLKSGFYGTKYIEFVDDFMPTSSYKNLKDIVHYKVSALNPSMFSDKMKITEYKIIAE